MLAGLGALGSLVSKFNSSTMDIRDEQGRYRGHTRTLYNGDGTSTTEYYGDSGYDPTRWR